MSDREKLPELIDRFNNGNLTGEELITFLGMLKTNPRLREEVRLDTELNEVLANEDMLDLRQKILTIQKKHQKRKGPDLHLFLLAASLLLLIGIEALLLINNASRNSSHTITHVPKHQQSLKQILASKIEHAAIPMDTVKKKNISVDRKRETELAASFRKNPSFENMIGATRHAGYFRLDAPVTGHRFSRKEEITFEWILDGQAGIELKIMDNTGSGIHESGPLRTNKYSLPPGTLKTGLYYFKIIQNDEIIFFGKFIVK